MKSKALNQAMEILKQIRLVIEGQDIVSVKLNKVMSIVSDNLEADAAACYVTVDDDYLELFASYGFNPQATHKVSLRFGEGLIGEVAKTNRSLVVENAHNHPKFTYKPELGEDEYKAFLGVPMIRWNRCLGVLTLQDKKAYEYTPLEVEILETIAMVLVEIVASDEMSAYKKSLIRERGIV